MYESRGKVNLNFSAAPFLFTKSRPGRMFKDQKQGISVRGRNWQGKWKTPFLSGIPWISGNLRFRKNAKKL